MKEYEVWMEGYRATGESAPHRFIGKAEAETFKDACYIAVKNWCSSEEDFKSIMIRKNNPFGVADALIMKGIRCVLTNKENRYDSLYEWY